MTTETLNVEKREQTGSLRMKRLRQSGQIPAVLYGHGEETVMLAVSEKELNRAINRGSYIVELEGATKESALIKDVQWDAFGSRVLHIDLSRVDKSEKVEVTLPIVLKGDPAGTKEGGMVNFTQHSITINCPVTLIPDKIEFNVSTLALNQIFHVSDVPLPEGAEPAENVTNAIVSCTLPAGADEPEPAAPKVEDDTDADLDSDDDSDEDDDLADDFDDSDDEEEE